MIQINVPRPTPPDHARRGFTTPRRAAPGAHERTCTAMWYFAWLLGIGAAAGFAVLNGTWLEQREQRDERGDRIV
ncbi:cytochrome bd-I oxidase subunit CydX [Coralloluteibacterium thermophilus]|uniref:Cytochrome bd-I oxidase subunit CydX n=1 Tax=Coralloluteibacterium thermophilum TaxID=2707049 RepID=A0ABV9NP00_9GAMM